MKRIFWEVMLMSDCEKVEFSDLTKKQFRELMTKIIDAMEEDDFSGGTCLEEDTEQVSFLFAVKNAAMSWRG